MSEKKLSHEVKGTGWSLWGTGEFLCGDGRIFQKDNHLCTNQAFV
jgi:hypothetical protein